MTMLRRRLKCVRTWSEKRQFRVSEAAVSGILCQREAELARCGGVESPFDSKQRSNFAFAKLPVSVRV